MPYTYVHILKKYHGINIYVYDGKEKLSINKEGAPEYAPGLFPFTLNLFDLHLVQ